MKYHKVTIELPDKVLLALALEAHDKDITLNEHCNNILRHMIKQETLNETHNRKPRKGSQ